MKIIETVGMFRHTRTIVVVVVVIIIIIIIELCNTGLVKYKYDGVQLNDIKIGYYHLTVTCTPFCACSDFYVYSVLDDQQGISMQLFHLCKCYNIGSVSAKTTYVVFLHKQQK